MAATKEFSIEEKLVSVITLQKIESKLDELAVIKGELPIEVKDLEDELAGLQNRLNRIEQEVNGINEFIEQKKQAKQAAEDLVKKYEKQSDNVKNSREFEALNKELEMQNLETQLMDKHIRDAMEAIGEKSRLLDNAKKSIANKNAILETKQAELEKVTATTEKEEKIYGALVETARTNVEERLLNSFSRIRSNYRNGLAIVPVERDACGGCFNAVPPQKQSEIKQTKKIMICENCGRILVDKDLFDTIEIKK